MKGQDLVILLKLISLEKAGEPDLFRTSSPVSLTEPASASLRSLEASIGISKSEISASQKRSLASGLATRIEGGIVPNRRNICEFIVHGLRYVFPASPGALQRGIPTSFAAPMLRDRMLSAGDDMPVWPWKTGDLRGPAIEPLFASVPDAAAKDPRLYAYLALTDAIRIGSRREANTARDMLEADILGR